MNADANTKQRLTPLIRRSRHIALLVTSCSLLIGCSGDESSTPPSDAGGDAHADVGGEVQYDGQWQDAFDASAIGAFLNVWGTGPEDVYTVGGQPDNGVAYHYDGTQWSPIAVPAGPMLYWVFGVDGEVWIVGAEGRSLRKVGDGDFVEVSTGTTAPLWGIWGAAADDIWAVGGDPREADSEIVMVHWTGEAWSVVDPPPLDRESRALFKVWGTSGDHVFAVGARGLVLYYDGVDWTQQSAGTVDDLISLWGTGPDDIAVAGGRSNGVLARWDGQSWTTETLVGLPGLNGVWVDADGTAHLVGVRGTVVRAAAGSFEYEREEIDSVLVLHGIWGVHGGPRFTVGGSLASSPPYTGIALVDP